MFLYQVCISQARKKVLDLRLDLSFKNNLLLRAWTQSQRRGPFQGEVVTSPDRPEEHSYRVDDQIGEGRCCVVYSAHSIRNDAVQVALKVYRVGQNYDGALQREMYMLELLRDRKHNIGEIRIRGTTEG